MRRDGLTGLFVVRGHELVQRGRCSGCSRPGSVALVPGDGEFGVGFLPLLLQLDPRFQMLMAGQGLPALLTGSGRAGSEERLLAAAAAGRDGQLQGQPVGLLGVFENPERPEGATDFA